ncbi:Ac81 protein 2 [Dolichomitus sp. PSUC_FEM 10030005]|nr:Ac81 protein 2 [Dolichomitus sp. PSUC_FEM 10030005]
MAFLQFKRYREKYAKNNIDNALRLWESAKIIAPPRNSIDSRLFPPIVSVATSKQLSSQTGAAATNNNDDNRQKNNNLVTLQIKFRNTLSIRYLQHWFVDIDKSFRWHPGDNSYREIFVEQSTDTSPSDEMKVAAVHELCSHCTYWFFYEHFIKDSRFDALIYNCEIITGFIMETMLLWLSIFTMGIFLTIQYYFFIAVSILCIFLFAIMTHTTDNNIRVYKCPHINGSAVNVLVLDKYELTKLDYDF